jgi:Aerotolerance regulator N-terminal/von Willebrand factor type A domain
MLSFLAPVFLAGAFAAAIPLVLHLLKREPEPRVKFAAVKLLKHAPVEYTQRRHLRELLLLALRIAALVLLALAFARPFFPSGAALASSGTTIVALDTSFSLSAPGRFERARQLAKNAIAKAPTSDNVGVVTFADKAEIAEKPGADRVLAASAIDRATVGFGATRYRAALSAGVQALAGRSGTIVVVTDLQESGWDAGDRASIPESVKIEVLDVGEAPPNFAVVSVRPLPDRLVATVRNAAPRARDARLHLTIDGRPAGDVTVSVAPNQSAEAVFAGPPRGKAATVGVDDRDGLQADNVRYALLQGAAPPSVLLVTGSGDAGRDAFYVQQALGAGGAAANGYQVASISAATLASTDAAVLASHPAVLLLSTRGLERRGRETLASYTRSGGGLLIAAGPEIDGDVVADVLGQGSTLRVVSTPGARPSPRVLAPADARHPVFQRFAGTTATFGLVTFQQAARISGAECQTLARFTTGETALLECPAGDGRALVLASDLDNRWNDFPLHASFVPFLHEAMRYLGSGRAHAVEYVVADAPAAAKHTPGVVTVPAERPGAAPRTIAVNVDPREADPARLSADDFQSAVTRLKDAGQSDARVEARQQEDRQHLWQYALAVMALLLVGEGWLAARTV